MTAFLILMNVAFICATVLRWQHVSIQAKKAEETGLKADLALLKAQLAETQRAVHKTAVLAVECGHRLKIGSDGVDGIVAGKINPIPSKQ